MHQIKEVIGDIFDSGADIIVHQTNCCGVMGAGLAKQIKNRHPDVYSQYKLRCQNIDAEKLLGTAYIIRSNQGTYIANCFGQKGYGRGRQQTDYAALQSALQEVAAFAEENGLKRIAIPNGIGCGLGGGNWEYVKEIIHKAFALYSGIVEVYKLSPVY